MRLLPIIMCLTACTSPAIDTGGLGEYELVWADYFDGPAGSGPDPSVWTLDLGTGSNGWGNNELQTYVEDNRNIAMNGEGHLVITARETEDGGYTSGRMRSTDAVELQRGRFVARIKLPQGQGLWPAFWLLGANYDEIGWPACGEVDVMEMVGNQPHVVHGTVHGPGYSAGESIGNTFSLGEGSFNDGFHVFAADIEEDLISWYVDGERYGTVGPADLPSPDLWRFDHPMFMLLNLAVGGDWPGSPDENTTFPAEMAIDYVEVYQRSE